MRKLKRTVPVRARKEAAHKNISLFYKKKKWQGDFCTQGAQKINLSLVNVTGTLKLFSADVLSSQRPVSSVIKINPFAPGDFAEKRVLKLVEWFSGHCRAIKS